MDVLTNEFEISVWIEENGGGKNNKSNGKLEARKWYWKEKSRKEGIIGFWRKKKMMLRKERS